MESSTYLLDFLEDIIIQVDNDYRITYINGRVKSLTGKTQDKIIGKKCHSVLFQSVEPCKDCQIENIKNNKLPVNIYQDCINHRGFRKIYRSRFEKTPSGQFVEILSDITENKKLLDAMTHNTKELKAKNVVLNIQKKEIEKKQSFLEKILNSTEEGIMVVNQDYSIVHLNYRLRDIAEVKHLGEMQCYMVYGFTEPCSDCPFSDKAVVKSSRKILNKNLTVHFNKFETFIVESVRDTTRELFLIDEIKKQQRELEEKQKQMTLLNTDLLRMNEKLQIAQKQIDDELKQVGDIQASLLPSDLPDINDFEFGALYIPAEHAGGDYYDCIQMSNGYWGFTVADVSGHGTPAAVIMAITRAVMRSYTFDVISASEALGMVNEILCSNIYTNDFVTMFYMVVNTLNGVCNFASAGHNPLLYYDHAKGMVSKVSAQGLFLGVFDDAEYDSGELVLKDGDIAFMYTDGLVEAMNPNDELYGYDRLISKIIMFHNEKCSDIINNIMDDVKEFTKGRPYSDDITILIIKKKGGINV